MCISFLDSSLNLMYVETFNYIGQYRADCSNDADCVKSTVLQMTPEFLLASGAMVGVAGLAVVTQALAEITNLYGESSSLNGLGNTALTSYSAPTTTTTQSC